MKILQANGLTLIVSSPARFRNQPVTRTFPGQSNTELRPPIGSILVVHFFLLDGLEYIYEYPPVQSEISANLESGKIARSPFVPLPHGGFYFNESVRPRTGLKRLAL